ncbi:FAD-dependent monooxygenase [Aquabacter cavernae]|uniref:FAD-dependent monooxygenase n=1 Tax=Aquabacter cavernae TaxID=2496029 RepID=UPI0013E0C0FB|nr:FAD-dependent monooxygenase [Aquabacter cavernae]
MPQTTPPVLIAGAGPTGLTLATSLHLQGIPVRIIDKLPAPAAVSKALAVWSGSLEGFAGLGLVDDFLSAGIRLTRLHMGDSAHELADMEIAEGVDSAFPFTLILPQSHTEEILAGRLARAGVVVERGVELVDFHQIDDIVRATLRHPDGRDETLDVPFLAGCDGARSTVRHKLDIPFEGYTEPETFILSDTRMDGPLDPTCIYIWWSAKGSVALFPVVDGVWRTFAIRDEASGEEPPTLAEIQAHLDACGPRGVVAKDPTWLSAFRVNERLAAAYRRGRVFLAGDAAHIHSPAGGQGMNTGIQDALNLGWKIGAILSGRGDSEALLESYEAERRPVAREVVANAARTMHLGMTSHGQATRVVRDALLSIASRIPAVRRKIQVAMSETAIAYEAGPLYAAVHRISGGTGPAAGGRAKEVSREGWSLWSFLSATQHSLLLFGPPCAHADLRAAARRYGPALDVIDMGTEPEVLERYGFTAPGWVLVRPDQFVAARGGEGEMGVFDVYARLALDPAAVG